MKATHPICSTAIDCLRPVAAAAALLAHTLAAGATPQDLTALPFERLLTMEVYSASRFVQRASEAPSSVTVITAADIRAYGWRTLGEVLRSVRGANVNYDRNYSYLGLRGFLRPGDYNTRFLLQIDGNRINDAVYDQAPVGGEFPLDLDLIERIEFVPGPGSSVYGANAFFGVVNVITRKAGDLHGARASVGVAQGDARKAGAQIGWGDVGGSDFLLAASTHRSDGRDLYFPEFDTPEQQHGIARGLDHERGARFYAKAANGPLSVTAMHAQRRKGIPTASFAQPFGDPRSFTLDTQTHLDAAYRTAAGADAELSARLFWGRYDSVGDYVNPDHSLNHDASTARWVGAELKFVTTRFAGHKLVAGAEFQRDYMLDQLNYDVDPYIPYMTERRGGRRAGVYLQDEVALGDTVLLNLGVRYDHGSTIGGVASPRLALIHKATPATTLKAMYGTAYRAPNAYELYYFFEGEGGHLANPALKKEQIRSAELAMVHQFSPAARVTASAFRNRVSQLITQVELPQLELTRFENAASASAHGLELEYERNWGADARLRTSYTWLQSRQGAQDLVDAPRRLAKLNLTLPLGGSPWRIGFEAQYVGPRHGVRGAAGGYLLANANLYTYSLHRHWDLAVTAHNLFDRRYADPASSEHLQTSLMQDGRTLRATLHYRF